MEKLITKTNLKGKEVKEMRKFLVIACVFTALLFVSSQVSAYTINSLFQTGPNSASDEDREYLIDREGDIIGKLDIGDSFRGMLNINTINASSANVGGTTGSDAELTAIYQLMLVGINVDTFLGAQFMFAPDPAFEAIYGTGAVAAIYQDPAKNFQSDFITGSAEVDDGTPSRTVPPSSADVSIGPYASEETLIGTATDGTLWAIIGFLGPDLIAFSGDEAMPGAGEGIEAQLLAAGWDNVLTSFLFPTGTAGVNVNLGLNLLSTGPAWPANLSINRVTPTFFNTLPDGVADFALSQQVRGVYDLDTPFEVSSNTNMSFNATVPEPSTLLLFGTGMLGLAAFGMRRRKM